MKFKIYLPLVLIFVMCTATSCPEKEQDVYLIDIEVANLDNSGENMFESDDPVNKDAYVIGVKYLVGNSPNDIHINPFNKDNSDQVILNLTANPKVFCNDDFNKEHPAGSDVTKFFRFGKAKDVRQDFLLILATPPAPGTYSFKVVYECSNTTIVKDTNPVTLF